MLLKTPPAYLMILFCVLFSSSASAQTTAFTYQGRLTDNSVPANGTYTMKFRLYASIDQNDQTGAEQTALVSVANGIFTLKLDFGAAAFAPNENRWLEIQVANTILAPRQQLTSAPYAIRSLEANKADSLSNLCNSCVTDGQIQSLSGNKITGSVAQADNAASAADSQKLGGVAANNYLQTTGGTINGNLSVTGNLSGSGGNLTSVVAFRQLNGLITPTTIPASQPFAFYGPIGFVSIDSPQQRISGSLTAVLGRTTAGAGALEYALCYQSTAPG